MKTIIDWCNINNGFLTGVLSIVGLLISTMAIGISIHTARLPYKKKVKLGSSILIDATMGDGLCSSPAVIGFAASATNIGNRTVYITYIGYAIKTNGKYKEALIVAPNLSHRNIKMFNLWQMNLQSVF